MVPRDSNHQQTALPVPLSPSPVSLQSPDGTRLHAWSWTGPKPNGRLVIAPGYGEHGGVYRELAAWLAQSLNLRVLALDFRGHGRSEGRRGVLKDYDQFVSDLETAVHEGSIHHPEIPTFVLGHSNGGLVTLLTALRGTVPIDGLVLSSPALKLKYEVPRHKVVVGRILSRVAPAITLSGPVPVGGLTRDPIAQDALKYDRLIHTRLSPPFFFGMVGRGAQVLQRGPEAKVPLFMLVGGADPIIDPDANRSFFDSYGTSEKKLFFDPSMNHNPLFERGRERAWNELANWLNTRLMTLHPDKLPS